MVRPSNRFQAVLRLIQLAGEIDTIERLHAPIQREIAASSKRIDRAKARGNEDYLDGVVDDEYDRIEELLGMAFVAAQTSISRFRSRLVWASGVLKKEFGRELSFASEPSKILTRGRTLPGGQPVIEAINAVANYWKHQEGWPTTEEAKGGHVVTIWNVQSRSLSKNERRTIEIVASLGMKPNSTGNLRTATDVLSVTDYSDLSPIRQDLKSWADDLVEAISQLRAPHP
jgi:hypothetical protein